MTDLPRIPEPDYTHALHARACQVAALQGAVLVQHVLAKRGPLVYCALITEPYTVPNGPDCWTLQTLWPEKTRITVPVRNVIACNPALCSCAAEKRVVQAGSEACQRGALFPVLEK